MSAGVHAVEHRKDSEFDWKLKGAFHAVVEAAMLGYLSNAHVDAKNAYAVRLHACICAVNGFGTELC